MRSASHADDPLSGLPEAGKSRFASHAAAILGSKAPIQKRLRAQAQGWPADLGFDSVGFDELKLRRGLGRMRLHLWVFIPLVAAEALAARHVFRCPQVEGVPLDECEEDPGSCALRLAWPKSWWAGRGMRCS